MHARLVTLGLALVVSAFAIGGDLAPPAGPIAPTFKTLDEVPTSTAVNASNTPGDAGAVYVITEPGHYHLTEDLEGVPGKGGIRIEAQDFVLDLNGHAVLGADGTRVGIDWRVPENPLDFDEIAQRGVVKNGAVRGWSLGVQMFGLGVVEDLLIRDNTLCGVSMSSAIVRRCELFNNADYGIFAQGGAERIEDCLIVGGTIGIRAESPCFHQRLRDLGARAGRDPAVGPVPSRKHHHHLDPSRHRHGVVQQRHPRVRPRRHTDPRHFGQHCRGVHDPIGR